MEGLIKVSPEALNSTASEFGAEGSQISQLTSEMMSIVTGMNGVWTGEASAAYAAKFNGLQDDIQRMVRMVQEHSSDLQTMATGYMRAESQNAQLSQGLQSDVIV